MTLGIHSRVREKQPRMDIALITYVGLPELTEDERRLLEPLRARGLRPRAVVWDDPGVEWERFRLAVVRTLWDYFLKPADFLAWLERVPRRVEVLNPPDVLRWNGHKSYLLELAGKGIPVTPTMLCPKGRAASLPELVAERGWESVVVKPAVSGGGRLTRRFEPARFAAEGQAHLEAVLAEGDALVQPFLPALHEGGERSYIFFDGVFSHAVVRPRTMEAPGDIVPDGVALAPRADEVALSERVLAATPGRTLYARVDVATGPDGTPLLQELEVIEPRLFLGSSEGAPERLADAIARYASR
jgi:glutathione synthase/RimK-type ligase-like ATP-grasp enzyme